MKPVLALADPLAPYICGGCGRRYETCPDYNAYDCPACGEKVGPLRFFRRYEARCHDGCAKIGPHRLDVDVMRADQDVVCVDCGQLYREHPGCFQTRTFERHIGKSFYVVRVLCDGRHVKL